MTPTFDTAMRLLLRHEGGYVNHPEDNGGMTNLGVTQAVWSAHIGREATEADMRALTPEAVTPIYRARYWDTVRADLLPNGLDYCIFDCAVNSGPGRAIKLLQYVLYTKVDGIMGRNTLALAEKSDCVQLIEDYSQKRLDYLHSLNDWKTFGAGWGTRVADVEIDAKRIWSTHG
jgi:lysozyme family protein